MQLTRFLSDAMARYRKCPGCCTHRRCAGGECGKCAYNPRSSYPVFHVVPDTSTEGQRLVAFLISGAVILFFFLRVFLWAV